MTQYLRYSDDVEVVEPDEQETFKKIAEIMLKGQHEVRENYGRSVRVSHAKGHGFVTGKLLIPDGLPPELAQGLFAKPGSYPVLVRLSQVPGEMLDDRKVSSPRGLAMKIFDVPGDKLPGHEDQTTQDFVLETGKSFFVKNAKEFLSAFKPNATIAPKLPESVKGAVSVAARAANAALHAIGLDSGKLDIYGHPYRHPLGESYYSQAAIRFGDFIAKVALIPASESVRELVDHEVKADEENALRTAVVNFFSDHEARYDLQVQLAVDKKQTPIEDPSVEWPEKLTPYRTVASLLLPKQDAYIRARQQVVDQTWSFAPGHSLITHRPLGSIMRARLAVYPIVSTARRVENGSSVVEPKALEGV